MRGSKRDDQDKKPFHLYPLLLIIVYIFVCVKKAALTQKNQPNNYNCYNLQSTSSFPASLILKPDWITAKTVHSIGSGDKQCTVHRGSSEEGHIKTYDF